MGVFTMESPAMALSEMVPILRPPKYNPSEQSASHVPFLTSPPGLPPTTNHVQLPHVATSRAASDSKSCARAGAAQSVSASAIQHTATEAAAPAGLPHVARILAILPSARASEFAPRSVRCQTPAFSLRVRE